VEWSGSRIPFSNARRGKLESVVGTVLLVDPVVTEDFDGAWERDELGLDRDDFDFGPFLVRPPIFSNAFKFSFVRRARFGGLLATSSMDLSGLRFRLWWLLVCGRLG
jgi:hypothetical protein